jgi:uncharacterized damage-inducible protein DinB
MKILIDQIRYNRWANFRLIDTASELDLERFTMTIISSFPSVQQTFVHIIWAEELWLERWQGRSFVRELDSKDYPTSDHIKQKIEDLSAIQIKFLKSLRPGDKDRKISYENFQGENWAYKLRQMVQHLILHSAYHRGQLVTLFRQLKVNPPGTDYLLFIDSLHGNNSLC